MARSSYIVATASVFVAELFRLRLSEYLVYHTLAHTERVADTARKIGKKMKLSDEGIEVVTLAGWFHDTGYTEKYRGHEEVSVRIAEDFLSRAGYPKENIKLVVGCIRATKIPQNPKNVLEEIVADADLAGLGRKSFFNESELLHHEWNREFGKDYSEQEWTENNINLLSGHRYFTPIAQKKYSERQEANLEKLQKYLHEIIEPGALAPEISEHETTIPPPSGYDMFTPERNPSFEDEAAALTNEAGVVDKKANMMTIMNSVLIGACIICLILLRTSGLYHQHGRIPLLLLLGGCVVSIFFSLLAARSNISVEAFAVGMSHKKILARKRRDLGLSYTIANYGILLGAIAFILHYLIPIISCVCR